VSTELLLIRHGQALRANGDYSRAPLTALGREQAVVTGKYLRSASERFDIFYSSPLRRAFETAELIGEQIDKCPVVMNGLQEMMLHEFLPIVLLESLARTGLFRGYLHTNAGKPLRWPIIGRVSTVLTDVIGRHPGQSIALVAHGGVISGTLAWYLPDQRRRWWRVTVDNCSLTRLKVNGTAVEIVQFNDTRHLKPQPEAEAPLGDLVLRVEDIDRGVQAPMPNQPSSH
jgi:broad specificity phosphatase PhoE